MASMFNSSVSLAQYEPKATNAFAIAARLGAGGTTPTAAVVTPMRASLPSTPPADTGIPTQALIAGGVVLAAVAEFFVMRSRRR